MLKNKLNLQFNLSNRKYKMIASELVLVALIVVLSQIISFYFPIEEPLREFGKSRIRFLRIYLYIYFIFFDQ